MRLNRSFILFNECKPVLNVSAGLEVHPASQCDACMCLHDVQLIHRLKALRLMNYWKVGLHNIDLRGTVASYESEWDKWGRIERVEGRGCTERKNGGSGDGGRGSLWGCRGENQSRSFAWRIDVLEDVCWRSEHFLLHTPVDGLLRVVYVYTMTWSKDVQLRLWPHRTFMRSSTCRLACSFYCSRSTLSHTLCQKPPPPAPKQTPILLPAQPPLFIGWPSGVTMGTAVERLPCRMWGTAFEWCLGLHHTHIYQGKETLPTIRFFGNISLTSSCI